MSSSPPLPFMVSAEFVPTRRLSRSLPTTVLASATPANRAPNTLTIVTKTTSFFIPNLLLVSAPPVLSAPSQAREAGGRAGDAAGRAQGADRGIGGAPGAHRAPPELGRPGGGRGGAGREQGQQARGVALPDGRATRGLGGRCVDLRRCERTGRIEARAVV